MPRTREELEQAAAEAEAWLDDLDPAALAAPETNARDLRRIGRALAAVAASERELTDAVHTAREGGRTWGQIALVLGVSKQAARQRFCQPTQR